MANIPEHQRSPWIKMQRGREPKPDAGPWTYVLIILFCLGAGVLGVSLLISLPQLFTAGSHGHFTRAGWILIQGFVGICCTVFSHWGLRYTWRELRKRD